MPSRAIFVGTAGWSVPRSVVQQFPAQGSGLVRYAHRFLATELNSTFWRRHQSATFERWRDAVPRDFRFAVKMPRTITHVAELRSARGLVKQFIDDVAHLGGCLGPVLVQLPPSLEFDLRCAGAFFRMLRDRYAGAVVCEPRHASWFTAAANALFVNHDIARVAADPPRTLMGAEPGGASSLSYFRLHGSPVMYRSSYGAADLAALADRLRVAVGRGPVWCIFDNTASGAAVVDALALRELVAPRTMLASSAIVPPSDQLDRRPRRGRSSRGRYGEDDQDHQEDEESKKADGTEDKTETTKTETK